MSTDVCNEEEGGRSETTPSIRRCGLFFFNLVWIHARVWGLDESMNEAFSELSVKVSFAL